MVQNNYSLKDMQTSEILVTNLHNKEMTAYLEKHLSITNCPVALYAIKGHRIKGRYVISRDNQDELNGECKREKLGIELLAEWDRVRLGINPLAKRC